MDLKQRPKRYIVIPNYGVAEGARTAAQAMQLMRSTPGRRSAVRVKFSRPPGAPTRKVVVQQSPALALKVVNSSPADGSVLVEANRVSIEQIKSRTPAGAKVLKEQWYSLQRPAKPWLKLSATLKKPRIVTAHVMKWTVTVVLDN